MHLSRCLPSNSWWQTMVRWQGLSGNQPPLQDLPPSHTRPPRLTAGNGSGGWAQNRVFVRVSDAVPSKIRQCSARLKREPPVVI
jgi:hypothetical protein